LIGGLQAISGFGYGIWSFCQALFANFSYFPALVLKSPRLSIYLIGCFALALLVRWSILFPASFWPIWHFSRWVIYGIGTACLVSFILGCGEFSLLTSKEKGRVILPERSGWLLPISKRRFPALHHCA
jgi:hypothetical protein